MAFVKIGTKGMPIPEKIQYARQIVTDMTANPNFTTPSPTLPTVGTGATSLETNYNGAETLRQQAKAKTALMEASDAALDTLLASLANYVQNASGGDPAKIASSGFGVRNIPAPPIGELPAPTDFVVMENGGAGAVKFRWKKVRGAMSFILETAVDAPALVFNSPIGTSKTRAEKNGLVSGTKYWFRVCAVGATGQGPWSALISKFAP